MRNRIYLDNNASTALDSRLIPLILEILKDDYANPSSVHAEGRKARHHLMQAREVIGSYFKFKPAEVIFTSGGTEALNMVMYGICNRQRTPGHIITSNIEHAAVFETAKALEKKGWRVTYLEPDRGGAISAESVAHALCETTQLIALMAVNNETGVKTDVAAVAAIAESKNIPFLVDGIAWLGKEPVILPSGVSAACFSAHKIHGPKGVGCACVRHHLKLLPLITGGEQEYGRRGGSENLSGIVGFSESVRLLQSELPAAVERMALLRNRFENTLLQALSYGSVNGTGARISNTSNLCFRSVDGETLLQLLDQRGVSASLGSACSAGSLEPSRVLLNMGLSVEEARSSLRFSLSRLTTRQEIDDTVSILIDLLKSCPKA